MAQRDPIRNLGRGAIELVAVVGELAAFTFHMAAWLLSRRPYRDTLTPNMYRSEDNPSGQPPEWFEAIRAGVLGNRAEFFRFVPENPFYGYNRDGAKPPEAIIANWWGQGMAGGALARHATVDSWLEDYTEDLKKISVPVLVILSAAIMIEPAALRGTPGETPLCPMSTVLPAPLEMIENAVPVAG